MATVTEWQESAITDFTAKDADAAFLAVIESIPAGRRFSVNDLRHRLDAVEVPDRRRGALFHAAITAGLIEPVTVNTWGTDHPLRIPSTGASANGATVRVYRRMGDEPAAGGAS